MILFLIGMGVGAFILAAACVLANMHQGEQHEWCDSGDTSEEDCLKDMLEFLKGVKG